MLQKEDKEMHFSFYGFLMQQARLLQELMLGFQKDAWRLFVVHIKKYNKINIYGI